VHRFYYSSPSNSDHCKVVLSLKQKLHNLKKHPRTVWKYEKLGVCIGVFQRLSFVVKRTYHGIQKNFQEMWHTNVLRELNISFLINIKKVAKLLRKAKTNLDLDKAALLNHSSKCFNQSILPLHDEDILNLLPLK